MKLFLDSRIFVIIATLVFIVDCKELATSNKQIHRILSLCGQFKGPLRNNSTRIVGGYYAKQGQFPSYVFLNIKVTDNSRGNRRCGGIILSDEFILTAAHCVTYVNGLVHSVRAYTGSDQNSDDGFAYTASKICVSKRYELFGDGTHAKYDIAILKLNSKIWFPEYIQPACLPTRPVREEDLIYAVGKGLEGKPNRSNRPLKVVEVGLTTCNQAVMDNSNFCFFARDTSNGISDICFGDSGGGLYIVENNKMYVVGVSSFSECGDPTKGLSGSPNLFDSRDEILDLVKECQKE